MTSLNSSFGLYIGIYAEIFGSDFQGTKSIASATAVPNFIERW